jgi:arginine decarboxylase
MGIAEGLEAEIDQMGRLTRQAFERRVTSLTSDHPPLPDFSQFHNAFRDNPFSAAPDGNIRKAYFMAYRDELCEYLSPRTVRNRVESEQPVVSAIFVTPYPPGFPVLVPGQEFSKDILDFMDALDTREIHGFHPSLGYRVFTQDALERAMAEPAALADLPRESTTSTAPEPAKAVVPTRGQSPARRGAGGRRDRDGTKHEPPNGAGAP